MTTEELSKRFYEKREELQKTRSNLSTVRWNALGIDGVVIGLAISGLTIHGKVSAVYYGFWLVFIIASLLCSYLEIRWEKKIRRLKNEMVGIIDQAVEQEETNDAE